MPPLFSLLRAFSGLLPQHGGSLTVSPYESERWRQVRDELTEEFQTANAVGAAVARWDRAKAEPTPAGADPDRDQFVHLWVILDALDGHLASLPLQAIPLDGGVRLVGQRWWATLPGAPPRPLTPREYFPHLSRGRLGSDEWVDDPRVPGLFRDVLWGDHLCVGICTLDGRSSTQFVGTRRLDTEAGVFGFRADSVTPDPTQELRDVVQWARERGVHVLFLPELSVDGSGREVLRGEIARDPGSLRLVVPGSFHVATDNGDTPWANVAPVWLVVPSASGATLVPLGTAQKREPFDMDAQDPTDAPPFARAAHQAALDDNSTEFTTLREDIGGEGHVPFVATPLGVFSALICKDALVAPGPYDDLPTRALRAADHLGLLSMNGSAAAWFWSQAEIAARQFYSASYYANTPQLVRPSDQATPLAFWLLPRLPTALVTEPPLPDAASAPLRNAHRTAFYRSAPEEGTAPQRRAAEWPTTGRLLVRVALDGAPPFGDGL